MRVFPSLAALALLALPLVAPAPAAQPAAAQAAATPETQARFAIRQAMARDHIPAMAVAVYRGDRPVWTEAFGTADLELGVPAAPTTLFRLGSVSKLLTATLAARLAQQGLIDLDRPVRDYLPAWPERHPPVTLRQLLGHLGGVRHYLARDRDFAQPGGSIDLRPYPDGAAMLAIFAGDDLVAAPGERFAYSTYGYTLAGLAIEAAAGEDFMTLLRRHVLVPGGIAGVHRDDMFALVPHRARSYDAREDYGGFLPESLGPVVNAMPLNSAYKLPGGGLVGDAASVARFGTLHFAPGFLEEAMHAQVFASQRTAAGEATGTGIGWRVGADPAGRRLYHHSGSQQGSRAHLAVYPDQRLSVVLLSNLGNRPQDIAALSAAVAAPFLDGR